jgi:hypothetical protein
MRLPVLDVFLNDEIATIICFVYSFYKYVYITSIVQEVISFLGLVPHLSENSCRMVVTVYI